MPSINNLHFEDFTVVWLDNTTEGDNLLWSLRRRNLQAYVNCIEVFVSIEKCLEYIEEVLDERIVFVLSGSSNEMVIRQINDLSQVILIYVLNNVETEHKDYCKQYTKVHGIFQDESLLITQLHADVNALSTSMYFFGLVSSTERSLQYLQVEQPTFLWSDLLIEVLLRLAQTLSSKQEMIDDCRASYKDNETQLKNITKFVETYDATSAIHWYTKDTFIYRFFNKAFRTQSMDIIIKYRYFLVDLSRQLHALHTSQFCDNMKPFTCYRGQYIRREELEKLEFSTGHLVAVNSFFSASKSCVTATSFSGNGEQHKYGLESVIFEIEINPSVCRKPFGEVTHESINPDEREVLFSIGSLFLVKSVELNIGSISHIILELTDEVSNELTNLRQFYQNEHIGENPSIVLFGLFLSKRGTLNQAENFYHRILEELPKDHQDVGVIYINLGEVLRHQGYLQLAQLYFKYALDIFAKSVTKSHPYYAIAYSNLGSVYSTCGQDRIALQYYKDALTVLETDEMYTSSKLISTVYHGMAIAYQHLEDADSAFFWYKKVLDLEKEILPTDHPSLSLTYGNLAELNSKMGEQILAREQFEKALSIMENSLPRNHLEHAIILLKYGYFLWKIERNASKALTYYQHAERIINQTETAPGSRIRQYLYRGLAKFYDLNEEYKRAIRNYDKLIYEIRIASPDDLFEIGRCSLERSISMLKDHDSSNAFKLLNIALACINELPTTSSSIELRISIAGEFRRTEHLELAHDQYNRLLTIESKYVTMSDDSIASIYNNLGTVDQDRKDYESAFRHYKKALEYSMRRPKPSNYFLSCIYHNIGVACKMLNNIIEARYYLEKALDLVPSSDNASYPKKHFIYENLAETYEQTADWSAAKDYYTRALDALCRYDADNSVSSKEKTSLQNAINRMNEKLLASI